MPVYVFSIADDKPTISSSQFDVIMTSLPVEALITKTPLQEQRNITLLQPYRIL